MLPGNDAARPAAAEPDAATRLIHLVLIAFGIAALASGDFAGDYRRALHPGFTFHAWAGLGMALAVLARLVWGVAGPREARFSHWLPVSAERLRRVAEDVRMLAQLRLPRRATHDGLAGLVQAFGLAAFAWMAATGTMMFFALEPGSRATGWLRALKEAHEAGEGAVIAYLVLHVGAVLVHTFAGDPVWRRMLPWAPPRP